MTKNIDLLILSSKQEIYSNQRFLQESSTLGLNCVIKNPFNMAIPPNSVSCPKYILLRTLGHQFDDFDLCLARTFNNSIVSNPIESINKLRDKLNQFIFFKQNNFPFVPTLSLRGKPTHTELELFIKDNQSNKFIVKTERGHKGIGVNLVNGIDSLLSILETFHAINDQKFIIQPLIENAIEYRLFYINKKLEYIINKDHSSSFKHNSQYCEFKRVYNHNEIKSIIKTGDKVASLIDHDYLAIDIISDESKHYILEVNLSPAFKELEHITSDNIANKILINLLNKKSSPGD